MRRHVFTVTIGLTVWVWVWAGVATAADGPATRPAVSATRPANGLQVGQVFDLDGRKVTLQKVDMLPVVENEFTSLFTFDRFENPKIKQLREKYKLDEVVAAGKTEFEKQVLLMTWAKKSLPFGSPPEGKDGLRNAQEILEEAAKPGVKFFCVQYASVLLSAVQAMGWPARQVGIDSHCFMEVWSNQHRKWVMLDPTPSVYAEKNGVPLNTYEIRHEWFRTDRKDLTWVLCKPGQPIERRRAADSNKAPLSVDRYWALAYVPNGDLMDSPPDWDKMIVVKDDLTEGHKFHTRKMPANPAVDQYFPLNQADVSLSPDGKDLRVGLRTLTPNFKEFQVCFDGGVWQSAGDGQKVAWKIHSGANKLQARSVNRFGVEGPVSTIEVTVDK